MVNRALAWVNKNSSGPFFLWVHCYDPHGPYDPPEPYKSRYSSAPYDGEIAYTDDAMGKLLAGLKARGLYENSVIVVTADHGEAFGEHGERHHGVFLYDETIHVPMIVKLPAERSGGERIGSRVRLVDIAPTVLELTGTKIPASMQGEVLPGVKKMSGAGSQAQERPAFAESIYANRAFGWSVVRSWRASKYLYVDSPKRELYDQTTDAKAENNLSNRSQAVADTLKSQLDEFLKKTASEGDAKSELSPEQADNLRTLGYLPSTSGGNGKGEVAGIDPKDKIEIANVLTQALFDAQEGHYEDAIPKLEQVLKQEPETPLAYFELGRAYSRRKEFDRAVPLLQEAVTRLPDDGMARYELGRALFENGNPGEAAEAFEGAVTRLPKSVELRFYMAVSYQRAKNIPEAMKQYKETLALDPKHFRANLLLGRMLGMEGRAADALPYLKTATQLDPKSAEAHTFLANIYFMLGQEGNSKRERELAERLQGKPTRQ